MAYVSQQRIPVAVDSEQNFEKFRGDKEWGKFRDRENRHQKWEGRDVSRPEHNSLAYDRNRRPEDDPNDDFVESTRYREDYPGYQGEYQAGDSEVLESDGYDYRDEGKARGGDADGGERTTYEIDYTPKKAEMDYDFEDGLQDFSSLKKEPLNAESTYKRDYSPKKVDGVSGGKYDDYEYDREYSPSKRSPMAKETTYVRDYPPKSVERPKDKDLSYLQEYSPSKRSPMAKETTYVRDYPPKKAERVRNTSQEERYYSPSKASPMAKETTYVRDYPPKKAERVRDSSQELRYYSPSKSSPMAKETTYVRDYPPKKVERARESSQELRNY
jgi:hypothetical protein